LILQGDEVDLSTTLEKITETL